MVDIDNVTREWSVLLAARAAADVDEPIAFGDSCLWSLFGDLASTPRGTPFVVAHLGQSLDGRIATEAGHSQYIGCEESIVHLHRLRALTDAVVVGVGTVLADEPRLTTRLVEGPSPVRVVLDPRARLTAAASVVTDHATRTIVVHGEERAPDLPGHIETIGIAVAAEGLLSPRRVLVALAERGLTRVLVEGGGRTVSSFIAAQALNRLQFAVAPLLIGSGRPALTLPAVETLHGALRPPCRRFDLGTDTLFEFDFDDLQRENTI